MRDVRWTEGRWPSFRNLQIIMNSRMLFAELWARPSFYRHSPKPEGLGQHDPSNRLPSHRIVALQAAGHPECVREHEGPILYCSGLSRSSRRPTSEESPRNLDSSSMVLLRRFALLRQVGKKGRLRELVVTGQKKGVIDGLQQDV
jgi:hypothetical protein